MKGIDVSHHQGKIDWNEVKSSGIGFVIMKAMFENGHSKESAFERNYSGADGIKRGAYIYNIARTVPEAMKEAEDLIKILSGRPLEYGVWLDMEDRKLSKLSKSTLKRIIDTEAGYISGCGYHVGIYCNKYWYNNVIDGHLLSGMYDFWIARYPSGDNGTIKESLAPRGYAKIWQYSSKGNFPGIVGNCDLDIEMNDLIVASNNPFPAPDRNLRHGMTGSGVKWLQFELSAHGYNISIDGIFGPATEACVRMFQKDNSLTCDGIAGPLTIAALID